MGRRTDCMGYSLEPMRRLFTPVEIAAAKRLAKPRFGWDVVGTDPRVMGWRFLRDAAICLRGIDFGDDASSLFKAEEDKIRAEKKAARSTTPPPCGLAPASSEGDRE